jgi:hypothetical protein
MMSFLRFLRTAIAGGGDEERTTEKVAGDEDEDEDEDEDNDVEERRREYRNDVYEKPSDDDDDRAERRREYLKAFEEEEDDGSNDGKRSFVVQSVLWIDPKRPRPSPHGDDDDARSRGTDHPTEERPLKVLAAAPADDNADAEAPFSVNGVNTSVLDPPISGLLAASAIPPAQRTACGSVHLPLPSSVFAVPVLRKRIEMPGDEDPMEGAAACNVRKCHVSTPSQGRAATCLVPLRDTPLHS